MAAIKTNFVSLSKPFPCGICSKPLDMTRNESDILISKIHVEGSNQEDIIACVIHFGCTPDGSAQRCLECLLCNKPSDYQYTYSIPNAKRKTVKHLLFCSDNCRVTFTSNNAVPKLDPQLDLMCSTCETCDVFVPSKDGHIPSECDACKKSTHRNHFSSITDDVIAFRYCRTNCVSGNYAKAALTPVYCAFTVTYDGKEHPCGERALGGSDYCFNHTQVQRKMNFYRG